MRENKVRNQPVFLNKLRGCSSPIQNLGVALRALTEPSMSRSPIVHCHFMLHFYERINDDDDENSRSIQLGTKIWFNILANIFEEGYELKSAVISNNC